MLVLFFGVWGLDALVFHSSMGLVEAIPLLLRVVLAGFTTGFGMYLSLQAHRVIFSDIHDPPRLIDSGVYAWVRHPMYLGILLSCLGFFFAYPSLLSLAVWVVFFLLYDHMTAYEENALLQVWRDMYVAYQARVPKWVPWIRRKHR